LFKGGELGVGHIAKAFRDRIGRKMQIQRLRWTAIAATGEKRPPMERYFSPAPRAELHNLL
jgi:hypothetical protein